MAEETKKTTEKTSAEGAKKSKYTVTDSKEKAKKPASKKTASAPKADKASKPVDKKNTQKSEKKPASKKTADSKAKPATTAKKHKYENGWYPFAEFFGKKEEPKTEAKADK